MKFTTTILIKKIVPNIEMKYTQSLPSKHINALSNYTWVKKATITHSSDFMRHNGSRGG